MIFLDVDIQSKKEVIQYLAEQSAKNGLIGNTHAFVQSVSGREEQVSTSIGFTIAIPHGKSDTVKKPFISYLRSLEEFSWDNGSADKVQNIFLIGVPQTGSEKLHLKTISEISKKLIDEQFRASLFNSKNKKAAFDLLRSINEKLTR